MEYYKIVLDESKLDEFISILPENNDDEVYYMCLFGRHKYDEKFPQSNNASQLVRTTASKSEIKTKIFRMQCPKGGFVPFIIK